MTDVRYPIGPFQFAGRMNADERKLAVEMIEELPFELGNAVATLIVYTNYTLRNDDGSRRQESDRHRVIVWGLHAEKAARSR